MPALYFAASARWGCIPLQMQHRAAIRARQVHLLLLLDLLHAKRAVMDGTPRPPVHPALPAQQESSLTPQKAGFSTLAQAALPDVLRRWRGLLNATLAPLVGSCHLLVQYRCRLAFGVMLGGRLLPLVQTTNQHVSCVLSESTNPWRAMQLVWIALLADTSRWKLV
jgi:hypothetical protein